MKQLFTGLVLATLLVAISPMCQAADGGAAAQATVPTQNVVELLRGDAKYALFVQALETTGLDQTLRGAGPYIVFAPTDEAFKRIPNLAETQKNPELLKTVCKFHIVPFGKTQSKDLPELKFAVTLQGEEVHFSKEKSLLVNDAMIVQTDLNGTNGVVHGIDRVLMPKSANTAAVKESVSTGNRDASAPVVKETSNTVVREVVTNEKDSTPVVTETSYSETSDYDNGGVITGTAHTVYGGVKHATYKFRKFFTGGGE
jgi:uncharacterized surface protein with fasciclin (FAS1) repeats